MPDKAVLPDVTAWSKVELRRPLAGGARNPVHLAEREGQPLVVRVSRRPPESLDWELDLLRTLSDAGVAVPTPVESDDGRRNVDGVLVHRFIPGEPPLDRDDWLRVVDVLRVVHEVTVGWPQRPGFASARQLLSRDHGGDVDLSAMPKEAARLVRQAWLPLLAGPESVVHGDVGAGNVLLTEKQVALIDWDEARVDVPPFDFAHLPVDVPLPVPGDRQVIATAGVAWETATCWVAEPGYARRRLSELLALTAAIPRVRSTSSNATDSERSDVTADDGR